jgi:hypothetical protein
MGLILVPKRIEKRNKNYENKENKEMGGCSRPE